MYQSFRVSGYSWAILLFLTLISSTMNAQYQPSWSSLDQRETPVWWQDAKFGIFIHWGLYSVPAYAPVHEVEGVYEKYAGIISQTD
jgi:alpha-L-fucosidase